MNKSCLESLSQTRKFQRHLLVIGERLLMIRREVVKVKVDLSAPGWVRYGNLKLCTFSYLHCS